MIPLLTRAEARKALGLSKHALQSLLDSGQLREIRIGARVCRIPARELERLTGRKLEALEGGKR
jgi:excisionase family DNA binding protein